MFLVVFCGFFYEVNNQIINRYQLACVQRMIERIKTMLAMLILTRITIIATLATRTTQAPRKAPRKHHTSITDQRVLDAPEGSTHHAVTANPPTHAPKKRAKPTTMHIAVNHSISGPSTQTATLL